MDFLVIIHRRLQNAYLQQPTQGVGMPEYWQCLYQPAEGRCGSKMNQQNNGLTDVAGRSH
jgi:hypothetical protein